jgi:uncharacterized protein
MPTSTVDEAIVDFGTCDRTFPHQSAHWTLDNWHEAGPRFIRLLEDCVAGNDRGETTIRALFFVVHLLAEKAEEQAFPALCRLAGDERLCRDVLGDGITETLCGLLISTWNGDATPLKKLIESDRADQFARAAALDALTYLTRKGDFSDEETRGYLVHLSEGMQPRDGNFVWTAWALAAATLGYEQLRETVVDLMQRGFIEDMDMNLGDFDNQLRRTLADPTGWAGLNFDRIEPFTDMIGSLSKWAYFSEKTPNGQYAPPRGRTMPHTDPWRKVGRNDPCPCGSGKKYKKCCLQ